MRRALIVAGLTAGLLLASTGVAQAESLACTLQRLLGYENVQACDGTTS